MQIGPFTIARRKAAVPVNLSGVDNRGGWWPVIRESFTGAWQRNVEIRTETVLTYSAVYACITLIASDIAKLPICLVEEDEDGIWTETENPAFSPVLREPNHFQTRNQFIESWMFSKLIHGNTYVLKKRDARQVVTDMYVLDPLRVTTLVSTSGEVFYQVDQDALSQIDAVTIPAREIIHDRLNPLYHPLVGISPITACGLAAMQGLRVQNHSVNFFENGSRPGGLLTAVGQISDETANRMKRDWESEFSGVNQGRVAVLGDGLTYTPMAVVTAVDAQLIEQLKLTAEHVCTAFRVPGYMVGVSPSPPYNNVQALNLQYYTQCLQPHIEHLENLLDKGLGLKSPLGTEVDLDDLLRMDTASRVEAGAKAILGGMSPNEVRFRFYDAGKVEGGETPYLQEQNWPLRLLSARELPSERPPTPPKPLPPADAMPNEMPDEDMTAAERFAAVMRKELAVGHAA